MLESKALLPYFRMDGVAPMTTLTVTAKGQVTLRKDVLRHLGIKPGDKIDVDLLPGGAVAVRAAVPERTGPLQNFYDCLGPWTGTPIPLEDLKEAAAAGWVGAANDEKDQATGLKKLRDKGRKA
jgi:AbrB family looped-hinge helix DNA binding protein